MRRPIGERSCAGPVAMAAAALVLLAAGCKPFSGPLPGDPVPSSYFIQHLQGEGTFPVNLDLGTATRDVYLTFVNPNLYLSWGSLKVTGSAAGKALVGSGPVASGPVASIVSRPPTERRAPTPEVITTFNQDPFGSRGRSAPSLRVLERPPAAPLFDTSGDTGSFYDYASDAGAIDATCRAVVGPIDTGGGVMRTLYVWVEDDCWIGTPNPSNPKPTHVTSTMVTALADTFLKAGSFDDIHDWVTAMLGAEWGPHGYANLIDPTGEITIFLCDIDADESTTGGVVGYFYSRDNFIRSIYEPFSNERVMFTIDAVMYANGDPGDTDGDGSPWDPTDFWPEEIFSTLAHEFQHMIHFYQRGVVRDSMTAGDTWINEMASQVVEDLLSDKMGVIGPRGVDGSDGTAGAPGNSEGRLPLFNGYNDISLSDWGGSGSLPSYSVTYAFGAWLARNYGGAALLDRLMRCTRTGPASIEDIVSQETGRTESFSRLLQRWSAAQLLSDVTDAPPGYRYNTGQFVTSTVGGYDYSLGSINLFNYYEAPVPVRGRVRRHLPAPVDVERAVRSGRPGHRRHGLDAGNARRPDRDRRGEVGQAASRP